MKDFVAENRTAVVRAGNVQLFLLKFADDIAVLAESEMEPQTSCDRVVHFSEKSGLTLHVKKCCVMAFRGQRWVLRANLTNLATSYNVLQSLNI